MIQSRSDHLDAGTMLRWIDGEATDLDRRMVDAHLAECATCTRELDTLREASTTVHRVLGGVLDVPALTPAPVRITARASRNGAGDVRRIALPRPRRSFGHGWRIAASIALLLGALGAVPELRALVLDAWRAMTGADEPAIAAPVVPTASEPEMRPIVEVTPADSFAVVFQHTQAAGRVVVVTHDSATAIILSSDPQTSLMVLPARVRIANQGSAADYQVVVPPTLGNLVVEVAGRRQPVAAKDLQGGGRRVIPLQ